MDMVFLTELRVFFVCGLCGVACGILYDMFRILRRIFNPGTGVILALDIIFWILCAVITFGMLFYVNYGRIRWYEWLGLAIGAGAYMVSASPLVTDGGTSFFMFLLRVLKLVCSPLFFLVSKLKLMFCRIKGKISKKITKNRLTIGRFWFRIKKRMNFYKNFLKK